MAKDIKQHTFLSVFRDQSGVTAIVVGLCSIALLGMAAFAIDIGHLYIVRSELQNAADAAALAAAAQFYPHTPSGAFSSPNWSAVTDAANANIQLNKTGGVTLTNCVVATGYWNLSQTPPGLQGHGITPGLLDAPAVRVTVSKSAGHNGGPIRHWFANFIGVATSDVSATATAIETSPGTVGAGALFPLAVSKTFADQASSHNTPANPITINSTSTEGQWTSFATDANSESALKDLALNGNPTPLSVGDNIWIEPGAKTAIYKDISAPQDVLVAVVNDVTTKGQQEILGFIGFHITSSAGGSSKTITGYFDGTFFAGLGGSVGPYYGTNNPPTLVSN